MGIFISQHKDPYKPTSIMESRRVFFVAQMTPQKSPFPTTRIVVSAMIKIGSQTFEFRPLMEIRVAQVFMNTWNSLLHLGKKSGKIHGFCREKKVQYPLNGCFLVAIVGKKAPEMITLDECI